MSQKIYRLNEKDSFELVSANINVTNVFMMEPVYDLRDLHNRFFSVQL